MPAGDRIYGSVLAEAVNEGRVFEDTVELLAGRMLSTFERIGAFDDEPHPEQSVDVPEHRRLARRAAAEAIVLLQNDPVGDAPILPLGVGAIESMAVIGPNAGRAQIMGGGSANLRPFHRTSPLDAIRARLGDHVDISYTEGGSIDKDPPLLAGADIAMPNGEQGVHIDVFDNLDCSGEPVGTASRDTSRLLGGDEPCAGFRPSEYSMRATTIYTPRQSGAHRLEVIQVTPTRVFVDGQLAIDGVTNPAPTGSAFFGFGSEPMAIDLDLASGQSHEIVVETFTRNTSLFCGIDLRVRAPEPDDPIAEAVAAAEAADVAVVVVGTNDDWETEGEDRTSLSLPRHQDALVSAVVNANPNTVVVVNTGAPVLMPWVHDVPAVLQSWLGGQEMADALVDVLTGKCDPGGRLPTSFPLCEEHTPSFGNFPGDNGEVNYAEGVFMGYRWYNSRHLPVLFPFGHGLSYTSFEIGEPTVNENTVPAGTDVVIDVPITNTGGRSGSHVVQCYVRPHQTRLVRPEAELKAFAKITLDAGETTTVSLTLDERAFAYWDPGQPDWPELRARTAATLPQLQSQERRTEAGWVVEPGFYDIVIGNSSRDDATKTTVELTA